MGKNVTGAANPQGSPILLDPSETIRRAPLSKKVIRAYLLGCLHDGTFSSNKRFRISQKRREWLEILKILFKKAGYNAWIYKEGKKRKVYVLETLANFLDFEVSPQKFKTLEEQIAYIRGFFDAEGGIPRRMKDRFYIQLTQKNRRKLKEIKEILEKIEIHTGKIHNPSKKVDPDYWRMYVSARSHMRFIKIVGSWHPRKIIILRKRVKI